MMMMIALVLPLVHLELEPQIKLELEPQINLLFSSPI